MFHNVLEVACVCTDDAERSIVVIPGIADLFTYNWEDCGHIKDCGSCKILTKKPTRPNGV